MKIFGLIEKNSSAVFGHGDSRGITELASDIFFKSRKEAEKYIEKDEKKPDAGQVINGIWVNGKSYLANTTIEEFELIE